MSKRAGSNPAVTQAPQMGNDKAVRYGDLIRLFRYRWGRLLPEDESGRGDLWLLISTSPWPLKSLRRRCRRHRAVGSLDVPDDREIYVKHVWGLDIYRRTQTGEEIGKLSASPSRNANS